VRFTIERMRTLVLAAGVLLVVALGVFLAIGKFRSPFSRKDIPKRLGIDIEQEANGVTYTQAHGGHTLFKIHASKVVQLKNDYALLHDVQIELYGADGSRVDRIAGSEFEYDQKAGTATAAGPVEITLMRPSVAPAVAPNASAQKMLGPKGKKNPLTATAQAAASGEIHVKTSGLTFDQKSGVATTAQRVDFAMTQGSGSSMGATYDSQRGFLSLNHAVELTTQRGADPVKIHASFADFDRNSDVCDLDAATADYRGGQATAAAAKILFRDDGTAQRLYAMGGFTLATEAGGHVAAPRGTMDFDEHNQPQHGRLEGGVTMDSVNGGRTVHGASPEAEIEFAAGELRTMRMSQGVELASEQTGQTTVKGRLVPVRMSRTWRSPSAEVDFRDAGPHRGGGKVEPASMRGEGGVVITAIDRRGDAAPAQSRLAADVVTGAFGPDSALTSMTGTGHASMEQTAATGTHETATGDRLEAHFAQADSGLKSGAGTKPGADAAQVQSATLDGHVVLVQQPAPKLGAAQTEMRATAAHAVYESAGDWLHLTGSPQAGSPRVVDGGLEMTADRIDVTQESGNAFAHGNVKATWANGQPGAKQTGMTLGGQGPAHVVADEAQLQQAQGQAVFSGNARLWQEANSVAAPTIAIDRQKQTLMAQSQDRANPVRVVLVSAGKAPGAPQGDVGKQSGPAVIRVRGGDLRYSDAERKAVMDGGTLGAVTAATATATTVSDSVELELTPAGNNGNGRGAGQTQVERMTATGHVMVSSAGRRGTGERLVYAEADGNYVLTGAPGEPPKLTDPARGMVTGQALIFHSRDDSVSIEGGLEQTQTVTTAPK
jgi:lipopolysaccharide export system protein LptA